MRTGSALRREVRPGTRRAGYLGVGTPDSTIEYAIAWSTDGLYFYARVHDPVVLPAPPADPPWEGDSFPTPDGYVFEAVVSAADLGLASWALATGEHVGFDIGLNVSAATPDSGTQGTRV